MNQVYLHLIKNLLQIHTNTLQIHTNNKTKDKMSNIKLFK